MSLFRLSLVVLFLLAGTAATVAAYVESRRPLTREPVATSEESKPEEELREEPGGDAVRRELTRSKTPDEESGDRKPDWAGA